MVDTRIFKFEKPGKLAEASKTANFLAELKRLKSISSKLGREALVASGILVHFYALFYVLTEMDNFSLEGWTCFCINCFLVALVALWMLEQYEGRHNRDYHPKDAGHAWTLCSYAAIIGISVSMASIYFQVFLIGLNVQLILGMIFLFPFCLVGVILLELIEYHCREEARCRQRVEHLLRQIQHKSFLEMIISGLSSLNQTRY